MTRSDAIHEELPDLVEQAGEWLLRLSEEDLPPEALSAWLEWYHADPLHRETFDQLQQEYERLKSMPDEQRRSLAQRALAEPAPTTIGALRPRQDIAVRPRGRRRFAYAAAACLVAALTAGLARVLLPTTMDAQTGVVQTPRGVDEERALPDGSRLALGGESTVSYRFTDEARYVVLESGEAYFAVAKDRARPFIVHVGGMTVKAVGTAFNIRRSSERVVVTVAEGIVDVQRSEQAATTVSKSGLQAPPVRVLRLSAGQEVVMSSTEQRRMAVKPADPEAAAAWKEGRLEFVDEPLSAVIATVNRYSQRNIVITDRELSRMTLTGSVMREHIDEWLLSLPGIYPAKVEAVGEDTVLISMSPFRGSDRVSDNARRGE